MAPRSSLRELCQNQGLVPRLYKHSGKMKERRSVVIKTAGSTDLAELETKTTEKQQ